MHKLKSRKLLYLGYFIVFVSMLITFFSAFFVKESEQEKELAIINRHIDQGMQIAQMRIKSYQDILMASAGLFNASKYVDKDEWKAFIDSLNIDKNYPGVSGISFVERVNQDKIAEFISREEKAYDKTVHIHSLDLPSEEVKYIVKYIEPIERNEKARWLDIRSNLIRRNAAEEAMLSGSLQITHIIQLVQDNKKKPGFIMFYPLYKTKSIPKTIKERRSQLYGWSATVFVGEKIMSGIKVNPEYNLKFNIYDNEVNAKNIIYDGINSLDLEAKNLIKRKIKIGKITWVFVWSSSRGLYKNNFRMIYLLVLGLLSSLGLLVLMVFFTKQSEKAIDSMDVALNAKNDFLSVMSHEIRTPLHGIIGMSEILKNEMVNDAYKEEINLIYQSGRDLLLLVNDVLDFTKIEKGKVVIEETPIQPSKIILEVIQVFKKNSDDKKLELSLNSDAVNYFVLSDELRLRQIMLNVISNAIKFTEHGFVKVNIKIEEEILSIEVQDSGIGMPEQVISNIFEPFTQADETISRKFGGTGLGMSIVLGLVKAMKGELFVDSEVNKGTKISLSIPVKVCDKPIEVLDKSVDGKSHQTYDLGINILLVEDNLINQKLASKILKKMNCKYSIANNGKEALEHYSHNNNYELILMDCSMPIMDGHEATKKLRLLGCKLPIIAFTANVGKEMKEKCLESGMDDYLKKPVELVEIYNTIKKYIS